MRYAYLFGPVALTVRYHVAHAPDGEERGARLEIQRLDETVPSSESESWTACLKEPIWRADLFTLLPGPPGNWERAHFYARFNGLVPAETDQFMGRDWDPELKRDPLTWTRRELGDVAGILRRGGATDIAGEIDQEELNQAMASIIGAVEVCMGSPGSISSKKGSTVSSEGR